MSSPTNPPAGDAPERTPRRRERRQQISSAQIAFAAILSIGLLLVINLSGRIARGQQMETERRRLQATIDVLETQKVDLLRERDYAASDASIEYWAHTEGKMVRDGEMLVIPIPSASEAEPTPVPPQPVLVVSAPEEPEQPKWRLWWNLFFDGEPPF
ncbi:MAG: hypothetical protein GXY36_09980 [Chloroflexi bacterium]|jgi:hypothetical protein|nr:hypothetical protein [Chloroflexota bacterium]